MKLTKTLTIDGCHITIAVEDDTVVAGDVMRTEALLAVLNEVERRTEQPNPNGST